MSAERVPSDPGLRLAGGAPTPRDEIAAWLDLLEKMLGSPARECAATREELESHLRERVRDLVVEGLDEGVAVRCALSELGDAAVMARRYRQARFFSRRRLIMNFSLCAAVVVAGVVGVVGLSRPDSSSRISTFQPPAGVEEHPSLERKIELRFQEEPLRAVFAAVSTQIDMPIRVLWRPLGEQGMSDETPITLDQDAKGFDAFLKALDEQLGDGAGWAIAYRVEDDAVKVATADYFDRREIVLASYELNPQAARVTADLIQKFVHPDGWQQNGGDLAQLELVAGKLFVRAPERYHAEVRWFIEEMRAWSDPEAHANELNLRRAQLRKLENRPEGDAAAPAQAVSDGIPAPLSAEEIENMDAHAAMKEWSARKKAASISDMAAGTRQRLLEEAEKCRERMVRARSAE